jgi:hypothetical protein
LVLSVPSHKPEKSVLADFFEVDCACAIFEILVPPCNQMHHGRDLRAFPMVQFFAVVYELM